LPVFSIADLSGTAAGLVFRFPGANLKLSAFSKSAEGNQGILAAIFPRWEALDPSPAHPRKPQLAWLFLCWVRTLTCPLFESVEIEDAKKP